MYVSWTKVSKLSVKRRAHFLIPMTTMTHPKSQSRYLLHLRLAVLSHCKTALSAQLKSLAFRFCI